MFRFANFSNKIINTFAAVGFAKVGNIRFVYKMYHCPSNCAYSKEFKLFFKIRKILHFKMSDLFVWLTEYIAILFISSYTYICMYMMYLNTYTHRIDMYVCNTLKHLSFASCCHFTVKRLIFHINKCCYFVVVFHGDQ